MERPFQQGSGHPVDASVDGACHIHQGASPMMVPATTGDPVRDNQVRGTHTMVFTVLYHQHSHHVRAEENQPPDNMLCSILCCLCCFWLWPVGLCAIIYAYKTKQANRRNDYAASAEYSKMTKYLIVTTIIGGVSMLNTFVLLFLVFRNIL